MMKKRLILIIFTVLMIFSISSVKGYAYEEGTLVLSNLFEGDIVEIYRIANYEEKIDAFSWTDSVSGWMENTYEGKVYEGLIPAGLKVLSPEKVTELCSQILMGLKNEEDSSVRIPGVSFTASKWKEEYEQSIEAGIYILLPKGSERIYSIKWFEVKPSETVRVDYDDSDYETAELEVSIANATRNRGGLDSERIYKGDYSLSEEEYKIPLAYKDDTLRISTKISIPEYSRMFSDGKRLFNLTVTIPNGCDYSDDTAVLYSLEDEKYELINRDEYTLLAIKNITAYCDYKGDLLFYGSDAGFFYEIDGENLPATNLEEALVTYNHIHGTEYVKKAALEDMQNDSDASESSDSNNTDLEEDGDLVEDESGVVPIGVEELEIETDEIVTCEKTTVLVYAFDTTKDYKELKTEFEITKNDRLDDSGRYPVANILTYSVSPLDNNLKAVKRARSELWSYGIKITACEGGRDSYQENPEDIIANAKRMTDDVFTLYRYEKSEVGNKALKDESEEPTEESDEVYLYYDASTNETYYYQKCLAASVNTEGEVSFGGLEPHTYLIVQTEKTSGYALSQMTFLINDSAWENGTDMEGNGNFELLWLDYPEYNLPGTGSNGRPILQLLGITLVMVSCIIMILRKRFIICK